MYETPKKYSTPQSKPKNSEHVSLSTGVSKSENTPNHLSVLKMLNNCHLFGDNTKGSFSLERSPNSLSDECVSEDRFIPCRRLIPEFDMNDEQVNNENCFQADPQSTTVAKIYSEKILGKINNSFDPEAENDIESFKNKNLLKFKFESPTNKEIGLFSTNLKKLTNSHSNNRKINKTPKRVLDAPALSDDFYLNVIDWSNSNRLAVGLGNSIFIWNAKSSRVTRLCEIPDDRITSVSWSQTEPFLSVGCEKGKVLIWDIEREKLVRSLSGHNMRVGSLAWGNNFLSSGSKDQSILQRDIRSSQNVVQELNSHNEEVCGLKWSKDDQNLASGGNDNKALVWSLSGEIVNKFTDHHAAVKAIAWSPHQHGLLATGGGTADRMIKLRNVFTGEIIHEQDSGSQVCSLEFSKSSHEIVSTHGYSLNEINIWSYPRMKKIASLRGHTYRVLYLALSPDGSTIVTGAGDETLRFWEVFPSVEEKKDSESLLETSICFR